MSKLIANYMALWARIFDFTGRSRREEYWYAALGTAIVSILIFIVMSFVSGIFSAIGLHLTGLFTVIYTIYYIANMIAFISLGVRRLHDIGMTGWLYLINLTGAGVIVLLILACMDSQSGFNKYGANPKGR